MNSDIFCSTNLPSACVSYQWDHRIYLISVSMWEKSYGVPKGTDPLLFHLTCYLKVYQVYISIPFYSFILFHLHVCSTVFASFPAIDIKYHHQKQLKEEWVYFCSQSHVTIHHCREDSRYRKELVTFTFKTRERTN